MPNRQNFNSSECREMLKEIRIGKFLFVLPLVRSLMRSMHVCVIAGVVNAWGCGRRGIWKQFVRRRCSCICPSLLTFCGREESLTVLITLRWGEDSSCWFCGDSTLEVWANAEDPVESRFAIQHKLLDHFLSDFSELLAVSFQNTQ